MCQVHAWYEHGGRAVKKTGGVSVLMKFSRVGRQDMAGVGGGERRSLWQECKGRELRAWWERNNSKGRITTQSDSLWEKGIQGPWEQGKGMGPFLCPREDGEGLRIGVPLNQVLKDEMADE